MSKLRDPGEGGGGEQPRGGVRAGAPAGLHTGHQAAARAPACTAVCGGTTGINTISGYTDDTISGDAGGVWCLNYVTRQEDQTIH